MTITLNTSWVNGSYEQDRLYVLRTAENPGEILEALFEGTSIAIGYGYDLIQHSLSDIKMKLGSVGVAINSGQEALLLEAKTATASRRQSIARELNLRLPSSAAALDLFNLVVADEEAKLTLYLNGYSIALENSRERLALLSMAYAGRFQNWPNRRDAPKTLTHTLSTVLNTTIELVRSRLQAATTICSAVQVMTG